MYIASLRQSNESSLLKAQIVILTHGMVIWSDFWWLVRVILVFGLVFLPQNFGLVVGSYEGLLLFCKCTWGGSIWGWWGHPITICGKQTFSAHRWWGP